MNTKLPPVIDAIHKVKFAQPFKQGEIQEIAYKLRKRWKYEEGYTIGAFDGWESAFTIDRKDEKTLDIFRHYDLNVSDPYHWRALLEALIRDYVKYKGRPSPRERRLHKLFDLAMDVIEVREKHLQGDWGDSKVAALLQKFQPYRDKYWRIDLDDLRKRVAKVDDMIGPMDDDALTRLAKLNPDRFMEVLLAREGHGEEYLSQWD